MNFVWEGNQAHKMEMVITFNNNDNDLVDEEETYPEEGGDFVCRTKSGRCVKRPRRLIVYNACDDDDNDDKFVRRSKKTQTKWVEDEDEDEDEEEDSDDTSTPDSFVVPDGENETTYSDTDSNKDALKLCTSDDNDEDSDESSSDDTDEPEVIEISDDTESEGTENSRQDLPEEGEDD